MFFHFLFIIVIEYIYFLVGDGDWGLGIGDWGFGDGAKTQKPKTKHQ